MSKEHKSGLPVANSRGPFDRCVSPTESFDILPSFGVTAAQSEKGVTLICGTFLIFIFILKPTLTKLRIQLVYVSFCRLYLYIKSKNVGIHMMMRLLKH